MIRPKGLGRGLDALLGGVDEATSAESLQMLVIDRIRPGKYQPRTRMDDASLAELANSIREQGIMQPILVRPVEGGGFEIIAGERRWRAAQRAGLHEVPVVVLDASDAEALELAIIENVQRTDLNPLEEATGYQVLAAEFNHSQDEIARIVGKSRSHVANTLRLLRLPDAVKAYINAGKLSAGHARALINQPDPEAVAREIVEKGLNVRQVEALGQEQAEASGKKIRTHLRAIKDPDTLALEKRVSDALGLVVGIDHRGKGGVLRVRYRTLEQLDDVVRRLESSPVGDAESRIRKF